LFKPSFIIKLLREKKDMSLIDKTLSKEKIKQLIINNFDEFIELETQNNQNHAEVKLYWKTNSLRKFLKNKLNKDFNSIDITSGACGE
jgi:hypothetical protein